MTNQLFALLILAAFYGIYCTKLLLQRRQGIRTHQVGVGEKPPRVRAVERTMSIATLLVIFAEVASISVGTGSHHLTVLAVGTLLGLGGVTIFGIAVYTMRDSWRAGIPAEDRTELVTDGIYCISRNPAFLGFDLVYAGILVLCFNWFLLACTLFAVVLLHLQILQEEQFLATVFGEPYQIYYRQVRRYLGRKPA